MNSSDKNLNNSQPCNEKVGCISIDFHFALFSKHFRAPRCVPNRTYYSSLYFQKLQAINGTQRKKNKTAKRLSCQTKTWIRIRHEFDSQLYPLNLEK